MIRHIVIWKLDDSYIPEEKLALISEMEKQLRSLKGKVTQLKSMEVQRNAAQAAETNFDIILDTTFDSITALSEYQEHPEHKEVVARLSKIKKHRAAIDYEV